LDQNKGETKLLSADIFNIKMKQTSLFQIFLDQRGSKEFSVKTFGKRKNIPAYSKIF